MADYELDRLGWQQFERLTQALIKAEYGAQIENWAGYRDYGKDAYFEGNLETKRARLHGPVVFQAKYVHQANAAGADYWSLLKKACVQERERITKRISSEDWLAPTTYILITNCPLTPTDRNELRKLLKASGAQVFSCLGASDIADLLDLNPQLARPYPQILTYRNLITLLNETANRAVAFRSQLAVAEAEAIVPVFVPTYTYYQALGVLQKYDFVVLSGPPEMGKTAIGRMLALSLIPSGWGVVDCTNPEDIFACYDKEQQQVFIADDAFGRTEYDVSRGAAWEAQFSKIYTLLDNKHWLIWTSRRHILLSAIREMDTQGLARRFPDPAEVIVKADLLSEEEKAAILFRHLAVKNLTSSSKAILRDNLTSIVRNQHFTPERIRRLASEVIPSLDHILMDAKTINDAVRLALENPTEGMQKSYSKLSMEHKWILTLLLEEDDIRKISILEQRFRATCPDQSGRPLAELLSELTDGFVKVTKFPKSSNSLKQPREVEWVHPSYRDMVIGALRTDRRMRLLYLGCGSNNAIALAISRDGGAKGNLALPLLPDDESWTALQKASIERIRKSSSLEASSLVKTLSVSLKEAKPNQSLSNFAHEICKVVREKWDRQEDGIDPDDLKSYFVLASLTKIYEPSPQLEKSWEERVVEVEYELTQREKYGFSLSAHKVKDFCDLASTLLDAEPRFLKQRGLESEVLPLIKRVLNACEEDADEEAEFEEVDAYEQEAERLEVISSGIFSLLGFQQFIKRDIENLADELTGYSRKFRWLHESKRNDTEESEDITQLIERQRSEIFNIQDIFRELLA